MQRSNTFKSKLPQVGTTIFTVMSAMAQEYGAINLSQGFPDFPVSPQLIERIHYHMQQGRNQYAPMPGLPVLGQAIAQKYTTAYQFPCDPDAQITITPGGTAALYACIAAFVHPGDEVIVLEPAYDSYIPAIVLQGGIPVPVALNPTDYRVDWAKVREQVSAKTRMIIVNNPHNPSGAVWEQADLDALAEITRDRDILILSDEVYEHLIYDGRQHQSVLSHEELRPKSMAVYSFGKTFHATGWKVGYVIAPPSFTREIRKIHQFMVFSVNTPLQYALADYLSEPSHYLGLPDFYQKKRDLFLELTANARLKPIPCRGSYFQLMSYADISDIPDRQMAELLTREYKVASIPVSVFYQNPICHKVLRFCFAKSDETIHKAAEILCKI